MSSSTKKPQLKSIYGAVGGNAPYFDKTQQHLHVWKLSNIITQDGDRFEQTERCKTVETVIRMKPGVEYCSVCHIRRPPIFRMKIHEAKPDWCDTYNRETKYMELKISHTTASTTMSETEELRKRQINELIESYKKEIPEMWKSGKYEEVQYYLKKMLSLGCLDAACELHKLENQLEKHNLKNRIVPWVQTKDQMHKLSQELEKKCNINKEPISSPLYKPSTQGPTWEMLGNLFNGDKIIYNLDPFVYKQEIFRNKAMEVRAFVREEMNKDTGKKVKVTGSMKKALRRKQVIPKYMNKPSLFIPKTGIIKGSDEWENSMILVLKNFEVTKKPSVRVVHAGGRYRNDRKCRVKLIDEEKRLLKVA